MRNIFKKLLAFCCLGVLAVGSVGCMQEKLSAYDIAVKNGFQGTETEWLLSLRGADGEDGEDLDAEALYQAAVKNGYTGSFLDFCTEQNITIAPNNDTVTIAENVRSVVSIYCSYSVTKKGSGWLGSSTTTSYGSQAGSGVIVSLNKEAGNALIITNYHVLYNAKSDQAGILDDIWVYPYGTYNRFSAEKGDESGDGIKATYVGGAMDYDIAILSVEGSEYIKNSAVTEAKMGNSDTVQLGEKTFVIGNPAGAGIAVTNGIVSVDSEYISMSALDDRDLNGDGYVDGVSFRVMRTSAAINSGNSGGGMFNAKGELIGIVNAKSGGSTTDNMGYALPITQVKAVYENVLANGNRVLRAMLGITITPTASKAVVEKDGNLSIIEEFSVVTPAEKGSAAYKKMNAGDVFISAKINNGEVMVFTREYQLAHLLLSVRKGDVVTFVMRNSNGVEETVSIPFDKNEYFVEFA
ncbi:MAG: trypsin-like peptidase domain-containing protein [Clostridia bacterium]|nr:trypsin-like peptidase domain-containing protein [Clostridia bacterium]